MSIFKNLISKKCHAYMRCQVLIWNVNSYMSVFEVAKYKVIFWYSSRQWIQIVIVLVFMSLLGALTFFFSKYFFICSDPIFILLSKNINIITNLYFLVSVSSLRFSYFLLNSFYIIIFITTMKNIFTILFLGELIIIFLETRINEIFWLMYLYSDFLPFLYLI